jgi:hypothetical protein
LTAGVSQKPFCVIENVLVCEKYERVAKKILFIYNGKGFIKRGVLCEKE